MALAKNVHCKGMLLGVVSLLESLPVKEATVVEERPTKSDILVCAHRCGIAVIRAKSSTSKQSGGHMFG